MKKEIRKWKLKVCGCYLLYLMKERPAQEDGTEYLYDQQGAFSERTSA